MSEFVLRQSIWEQIEDLTKHGRERNIIKKIVGESLIDETLDLHQELQTLYEIWLEYNNSTQQKDVGKQLGEPPLARENVVKHVCLLVQLIHEKAQEHETRPLSMFLSEREQTFVEKTLEEQQVKESEYHIETAELGRRSSTLLLDIEAIENKLNSLGVDDIAQPIRDDLEEEKSNLLHDIQYLQETLINASEDTSAPSPSLKELRKIESKLELEILKDDRKASPSSVGSSVNDDIESAFLSDHEIKKKYSPSPPSSAVIRRSPHRKLSPVHRNSCISPPTKDGKPSSPSSHDNKTLPSMFSLRTTTLNKSINNNSKNLYDKPSPPTSAVRCNDKPVHHRKFVASKTFSYPSSVESKSSSSTSMALVEQFVNKSPMKACHVAE